VETIGNSNHLIEWYSHKKEQHVNMKGNKLSLKNCLEQHVNMKAKKLRFRNCLEQHVNMKGKCLKSCLS